MSNRNRTAGHNWERETTKKYRELGFNATTSRYTSREKDDQKVDLCGTEPINIQAKFTKNYPDFHSLLNEMPNDGNYNVVHHKRNRGKGKPKEHIVVMLEEDWLQIVEVLKTENII